MTEIPTDQNSTTRTLEKFTFKIVCEQTDQVVSGGHEKVITISGKSTKTDKDHTRMFTTGLKQLVVMDLQGNELRVFLACVAFSDFENTIEITNKGLSKLLKIRPENISRHLHKLHALGMIYIHVLEGGKKIARVQPEICWKGSEKLRSRELKRRHQEFSNEIMDNLTGRPEQTIRKA